MSRIAANKNLIKNQHFLITFKFFLEKYSDIKKQYFKLNSEDNFLFHLIVTKLKKI